MAGPTASGKSALALAIAERHGGCVINADALQVYACWRVLTARPTDADLARAPHGLYGHVSCDVRYSAGEWLRDVRAALADARRRGLRPIVVGGTGLYFGALTEGLASIPEISHEIDARSEEMLRSGQVDTMLADLARDDPETLERIDRRNPRRVQRAWNVLVATGRGLADWHRTTTQPALALDQTVHVVLSPETSLSNSAIEERFHKLVELGALDECRRFLAAGHRLDTAASRALGARPLIAHLKGERTLDEAAEAAIAATRQFAKRQRTWFRNRMPEWPRIDPASALAEVDDLILKT